VTGEIINLHSARLDRIEQKAEPGSARELLAETLDMVARLEVLVAKEDQAAENVAAAEARRGFHLV
jgi:hypothetical protein